MAGVNEQVAEQIEEVAERIDDVAEVTRRLTGREASFFFAGAGLGIAGGFAAGYFIVGKRLKTKYSELAEEEISQMRKHYRNKVAALDSQIQNRRPLEELVVERGYAETGKRVYTDEEVAAIEQSMANAHPDSGEEAQEAVVEIVSEQTTVNVFESNEEWDYEAEVSTRRSDVPYIIHIDEFLENPKEHEQVTFTYYETDDVLVDVRDQPVDQDETVGVKNIGRWGHGSKDPNVVYVRNEELSLDFEICRDPGSWSETTDRSIRHSATRMRRRPNRRFDDE
jgi:hypothetical protein